MESRVAFLSLCVTHTFLNLKLEFANLQAKATAESRSSTGCASETQTTNQKSTMETDAKCHTPAAQIYSEFDRTVYA